MTRRHVRPSDFDPSADDGTGSRYAGSQRWEGEHRYVRSEDERGRGDDRFAAASRDYEDRIEASERRAIETASKTAETLSSMASWIERAQQQLTETTQMASRIEATTRETRGAAGESSVSEALSAIRRIEERLAAQQEQQAARREPPDLDQLLRGFEARVGEMTEKLTTVPKMAGRRPLKPGQALKTAVDDIRGHQSRLERDPYAQPRATGLPALGSLARSQTAMLTTLKQEIAKLASRIEDVPSPRARDEQVQREVETLRQSMAEVARREDLTRLERGLKSLTSDIMELRQAGDRASAGDEIAALQAEIRQLAQQRGGPELAAVQAELRRLSERDAAPVDLGPVARDIQGLSRKLDRIAEGGFDPGAIGTLSSQIESVRRLLGEAGAPQALGIVDEQLAAIRRDIAEVGGRQVAPREIEALRDTMEDLRASLTSLAGRQAAGPDIERAVRSFGQPIEATLSALVDKIERVERRVSDPEALDQLERQIQMLAARIGDRPGRDPAVASLERSMGDLLEQVSSWRQGAVEAAEHAARTAVAETIDAMPVAAEVERHLMDIGDRYAAAEERTRQSLTAVHTSLSDVMARLASLETTGTRPDPMRPSFQPPRAAETAGAPGRTAAQEPRLGASLLEADQPFAPPAEEEVLLEPGASRPTGRTRQGTPAWQTPTEQASSPSGETPDIKSSFIAAARRAAQAAAAETQTAAKPGVSSAASRGTMSPSDMLGRVRRLIDSKRRPLLLAAAAIVLALGTMQIVRTQFSGGSQPATVATAPAKPAMPQSPPRATAEAPAQRGEVTAATTPAPVPAAPPASAPPASVPADPATTQSINPAPSAPAPVQIAATQPVSTASKDASRVGDPAATPSAARPAGVGDTSASLPVGIKQAADRGNPVALYDLAARTADGRGVSRDPKVAVGLFEKAAEKGLAPAQYRLGNSYERGVGVTRDIEQAKSWYRRAAQGGNVRAMHNLAVLLADGGGAKPDYAGAVEWFTRAAEHGVKDSQFNLAVLHARGLGTSQDFARAYHWLAIAAQQGDEDAGKKRDEVGQRLGAQDLARAKAGVESWRATPAAVAANEVLVPPSGFAEQPASASKQPLSANKRPAREARV